MRRVDGAGERLAARRAAALACGLLSLALVAGCSGLERPDPQGPLTGLALVEALREGGHVLYLRHAATDEVPGDQPDPLGDCRRQRLLSDAGRADARALGAAVRALDVPVGDVVASPYCRTVETAELAFRRVRTDPGLLPPAADGPDREQVRDRLHALAGRPPDRGENTVLVGHLTNLRLVRPASPEEGGTLVLRPGSGRTLQLVGAVPPQGWQRLAERHADQAQAPYALLRRPATAR